MSKLEALKLFQEGRPEAAAALLQTWLLDQSSDAHAWFLLGACRHATGDLTGAAEAFAQCLSRDRSNVDAHLGRIMVLREAGDLGGALAAGREALARLPQDSRLRYATALCLDELGHGDEALAEYDLALKFTPSFEEAWHNRGLLLAKVGRLEEAEASQRRYLAAAPQSRRAQSGLVDILLAQGRLDDAWAALDRLAQLAADDVSVPVRRGVVLASKRDYMGAHMQFAEARRRGTATVERYLQGLVPGSDSEAMLSPQNIYLGRCWKSLGRCDWSEWEAFAVELRRAAADPTVVIEPAVGFMSRLLPLSGSERHAVCRHIAERIEARSPALPRPPFRRRPRIRVGVLSPDFREHLNAYLLRPFFELLDRDRFEAYAYSLCPDDGSDIGASVRSSVDRFQDLHILSDDDAAQAIRGDDVDILLDVGGHTTGARFAITGRRPARLQVNYLGFSCSLASRRVDYAIVDRIVGRDDAEWTEARAYLPETHFLYDFRGGDPEADIGRRDYGLPDDAFVYCAFHQAEKISPDAFLQWMAILSRVPRSVLWFRALPEDAARNLRSHAAANGVDPNRLAFAPFEPRRDPRYLARHRLGDLMLDSPHHNAMTSACDALRMGLPVLTLPGQAMASRAGESLLRAARVPELISANAEDYVRTAVSLGRDPGRLRQLRLQLVQNRKKAPLFDTASRVRALEAALLAMYERLARGEPPETIEV